jgi:ABC-type microcin C transport system permease subunit YejB
VFSLDGLGLLGLRGAIQRDYPVMFGTLYIFTLLGLVRADLSATSPTRWSIRASISNAAPRDPRRRHRRPRAK